MKALILSVLVFGFGFSVHAEELGKQVKFYVDQNGPQFSSFYSHDRDVVWTATGMFWGPELLGNAPMQTLAWRLYDGKTQKYINSWQTLNNDPSPIYYPGTMAYALELSEKIQIKAAIQSLRFLKIVLAVNQNLAAPQPTHFIDLGAYCDTSPDSFLNLTTSKHGCSK